MRLGVVWRVRACHESLRVPASAWTRHSPSTGFKYAVIQVIHDAPALIRSLRALLLASFAAVSLGQEVVRMIGIKDRTDRITKVHMNQLPLSDSCLFIFYAFLFPGECLCPLLQPSFGCQVSSVGYTQFFFGPLAWCFQTFERTHRTVSTTLALPAVVFFFSALFCKQSRVIIEW